MTSAGAVGWVVDSLTSPSGGKAMRTQPNGIVGTALTLTSQPISTLNQFKVWLDFNHIARFHLTIPLMFKCRSMEVLPG